jgi:flagellar biosynthesis/type III secretory pathway protein FliH
MNMKSLLKTTSADSNAKTWNVPELDADLDVAPDNVHKDQVLELFRADKNTASRGRDGGSRSTIHPAGAELFLTNWLPGDMNFQPQVEAAEEWTFIESAGEFFSGAQRKIRKQQPAREKENAQLIEQARAQAEEILLEARAAAERLIQQAHAEIDQAKQAGHQQGWDDARRELRETLNAVHAVVAETHVWQSTLMQQGEQFLVEMLKEISQTMFGEGVQLDANALQVNLNRIMEHAQRLGDLNILLNPRDAHLLDTSWSEYQFLITGNKVRIIPSEKITPGGCVVKGNMGMVDGRVETQLASVLSTIDEIRDAGK